MIFLLFDQLIPRQLSPLQTVELNLQRHRECFYLFERNIERIIFSGLRADLVHVARARKEEVAVLKEEAIWRGHDIKEERSHLVKELISHLY